MNKDAHELRFEVQVPWSDVSPRWGHSWHSMCSYLGTFPPAMARVLLGMFSDPGDLVLDPFSGRGTTLLEARLIHRMPIASDLNPLAVALTAAKNVDVNEQDVLARVESLRSTFDRPLCTAEARVQDQSIQLIFHPHTLAELCYLRRRMKPEDPIDAFLLGVTLGIMHGNERKDGKSAYASISMPNTFSMSPDYVRRFVQQKRLQHSYRNVFDLLTMKISKLFAKPGPQGFVGSVTTADAKRMLDERVICLYRGRITLTLTSPPYLDVVNYAKQNWIRMWLLGRDPVKVQESLNDNLNISSWLIFMQAVLAELQQLMRPDGVIILVIGDVARSRNSIVVPARELVRQLKHDGSFRYIGCISDRMNTTEKVTRIWTETKGQATAIDRILVLSQETPKIRHLSATPEIPWNIGPLNADDLAHHANYFSTSGL